MESEKSVPLQLDPIRPWFDVLESMGEYIGIRFAQVNEKSNEPVWIDIPHNQYDGIGGFAKILRDSGAGVHVLPKIPHGAPVSWLPFIKSVPRFLLPRKRVSLLHEAELLEPGESCKPQALAWHIFSKEETLAMRKASRLHEISVNSLLLRHLDKSIRQDTEDPSVVLSWMIPVNLRGKIRMSEDTGNHSSYITVNLTASSKPNEIHNQIYKKLNAGEHWSNWMAFRLGKYIPFGLKRKLLKKDRVSSRWHIGSFSNLGIWDSREEFQNDPCKGPWIFAPPVLETQRIGAGCITFQNQL